MKGTLFVAVLLCISLPRTLADGSMRIPRILHRNFMEGAKALRDATRDPRSGFKAHWLDSCRTHNRDWQEIVWDAAAVLQLAQEDFPWVLPAYLAYPKLVQRSDIARYMILYKYGGVYLDADVECYGPLSLSLAGKDLVLNCEYPEAQVQLHNAAMASVPDHPFWLEVLKEALARALTPPTISNPAITPRYNSGLGGFSSVAAGVWGSAGSRSRQLLNKLQQLWEATPWHDKANAVLWSTGPMLLTAVYKRHIGRGAVCGRSVDVGGHIAHAYELGSWFTPCLWNDAACQRKWITQHMLLTRNTSNHNPAGRQQQQQPLRQQQQQQHSEPQGSVVVGIHHYSGSWMDWDSNSKRKEEQQLNEETSQHVLHFFRDSPLFIEYNCSTPLQPSSSNNNKKQKRPATGLLDGPIPLCMEFLTDALATNTCTVVSVLGPTAAASAAAVAPAGVARDSVVPAAGSDASEKVSTELLLQQLGCHLTTASPHNEPPAALSYLLNTSDSTSSNTPSRSTTSSSSRGTADTRSTAALQGSRYHHVQVLLEHPPSSEDKAAAAAADAAQGGAVPLLSLLQQDPWDVAWQQQQQQWQQEVGEQQQQQEQQEGTQQEEQQQQQQAKPEQAAQACKPEASRQLQRRYVLRLSCGSCRLAALQQLFEQAADSSLLQQTDLLLLETHLHHPELAASNAGAARTGPVQKEQPTSRTAAADAEATQHSMKEKTATAAAAAKDAVAASESIEAPHSCVADTESTHGSAATTCSDADSSESGSSSSSCEAQSNAQTCGNSSGNSAGPLPDLAAVYNLLYQQHGLVGFMRQQLPCGVVRLGWVRQPGRMSTRAAAVGSAGDAQLLRQLGL